MFNVQRKPCFVDTAYLVTNSVSVQVMHWLSTKNQEKNSKFSKRTDTHLQNVSLYLETLEEAVVSQSDGQHRRRGFYFSQWLDTWKGMIRREVCENRYSTTYLKAY